MKKSGDIREGIWILAVLCFFAALALVGIGTQMLSLADVFRGTGGLPLADPATGTPVGTIGSGVFAGIGILLIALGVFLYFVGRGLLKAKKWSKIAKGVCSALLVLFGVLMILNSYIFSGLVALAIGGLEIWYLFFKESTKKYFKN